MKTITPDSFDALPPYLFQRVKAPMKHSVAKAFAFGGGGSGLSKEATEIISKVLEFDYMGAAEFEFGECANCISFMNEHAKDLKATEKDGFFFLTNKKMTEKAHDLWQIVVKTQDKLYHHPGISNPNIVGWFDFNNGWFVSRTAEMRDNLHKILLEC